MQIAGKGNQIVIFFNNIWKRFQLNGNVFEDRVKMSRM